MMKKGEFLKDGGRATPIDSIQDVTAGARAAEGTLIITIENPQNMCNGDGSTGARD